MGCPNLTYRENPTPLKVVYNAVKTSEKGCAGLYRYGFNGKEKDDETGTQDYGMRIYNPSLGRFLSVDPLTKTYPMLTPYQFASNTPIQAIDLDGLEAVKVVDHSTKTTTILVNVVYVPNSVDNPNSGSGFSQAQVDEIKAGVNNQIAKGTYFDKNNKDSDGNSYKVNVQVNFVQATSMEDAKQIRAKESDRTVLLEKGQYKVSEDRRSITLATTEHGAVRLNSSSDSHTNTHEVFHSIVHFSKNTPNSYWDEFSPNNQGPWHAKFGGIFQYQEKFPVSQDNIDQALQATPTVAEIPVMGPYTPAQQKAVDDLNAK